MRKIFTFIMCLFGIMAANAETTTIWETSSPISAPEWGSNTSLVSKADVATFISNGKIKVGTKFKVYGTRTDESGEGKYCTVALINNGWTSIIDGTSGDNTRTDIKVDNVGDFTYEFTAVQGSITALTDETNGGIYINGHGYTLTKIEVENPIDDLPAATLWQGSQEITNWGTTSLSINATEALAPFKTAYTSVGNMYILVEPSTGANIRIAGLWGAWSDTEFPSANYGHEQNMDVDNVVKVELTQDFINKAFGTDGKGFALWGDGYTVKVIGTTKSSVLNPTAVNNVNAEAKATNGTCYNLAGQRVAATAKGIVIINGKKIIK